ncbi:MAG: plasmid mobilization relaxosome protein MobC [Parabacteroides sp.]|nr:plasmid mobilization relaxosome protein MobC [Parabacteroides sp.]
MRRKSDKTARLNLRVSPKLKAFLETIAEIDGKTLNDTCIAILSNRKKVESLVSISQSQKAAVKLFSSMSNNINQIAKHCNKTSSSATREDLFNILNEARKMQLELLSYLSKKEGA